MRRRLLLRRVDLHLDCSYQGRLRLDLVPESKKVEDHWWDLVLALDVDWGSEDQRSLDLRPCNQAGKADYKTGDISFHSHSCTLDQAFLA